MDYRDVQGKTRFNLTFEPGLKTLPLVESGLGACNCPLNTSMVADATDNPSGHRTGP